MAINSKPIGGQRGISKTNIEDTGNPEDMARCKSGDIIISAVLNLSLGLH